jgi:hypothetical protein
MAVMVLGYVVIWAIWHFFFREAGDHVPGERPATVPLKLHDSQIPEPHSSADRSGRDPVLTGPQATARAAQALGRVIGDGEASTGSRTGNDAPCSEDDRQA